jgi:hypothetical protein
MHAGRWPNGLGVQTPKLRGQSCGQQQEITKHAGSDCLARMQNSCPECAPAFMEFRRLAVQIAQAEVTSDLVGGD